MPPLITDTDFLKIRGLFRYLVLYVLREKPLHGYAIMKKISMLFDNVYVPSPGVLYPTLQLLEEMGLIESTRHGRRKVYSLTPSGRKLIEENRREVEDFIRKARYVRRFVEETGLIKLVEVIRKLYETNVEIPLGVKEKIRGYVEEIIGLLSDAMGSKEAG